MKKYTFYFEIFGHKHKWSTVAFTRAHADVLFREFLSSRANVLLVKEAEGYAEPEGSIWKEFDKFIEGLTRSIRGVSRKMKKA